MGQLWQPERALKEKGRQGPQPGEDGSIRLLICNLCQKIETVPAYSGDPDEDFLLKGLLERHGHREMNLGGDMPDMRIGNVWLDEWSDSEKQREIIKTIRESEGHTGLGDEFYAAHDTYREEAGKCFNAHRRPTECIDYQTPGKLLGNTLTDSADVDEMAHDMRRSKRELARSLFQARQKVYLCDFCVVKSVVMQKEQGTWSEH